MKNFAYPAGDAPFLPVINENEIDSPATPMVLEGGEPLYPIDDNSADVSNLPITAENSRPICPICPIFPGIIIPVPSQKTLQVRFFHAATNIAPCDVSIGTRTIATNLRYMEPTNYHTVAEGFRTVTVMSAQSPRTILLRKNISFRSGENMTLVIVNSSNGIDLLAVPDTICSGLSHQLACLRMVNASYHSGPMDMILFDGRVVFSDVTFKEITSFRRVRPGEYGFYIALTPYTPLSILNEEVDVDTLEEMPIAVSDNYIPGYGELEQIAKFYQIFRANVMYTTYVVGDGSASYPYTVIVLETPR